MCIVSKHLEKVLRVLNNDTKVQLLLQKYTYNKFQTYLHQRFFYSMCSLYVFVFSAACVQLFFCLLARYTASLIVLAAAAASDEGHNHTGYENKTETINKHMLMSRTKPSPNMSL